MTALCPPPRHSPSPAPRTGSPPWPAAARSTAPCARGRAAGPPSPSARGSGSPLPAVGSAGERGQARLGWWSSHGTGTLGLGAPGQLSPPLPGGCCGLYLPGNQVLQLLDVPLVLRVLLQVGLLEKGLQQPPLSPAGGWLSAGRHGMAPAPAQHLPVLTISYLAKPPMTAGSTMPLSSMESGLMGRLGSFWCRLISLIIFSFVFIMVSMAFSRGEMVVCAQGGSEGQQLADPATCPPRCGRQGHLSLVPGLHISPHEAPRTPGTGCLELSRGLAVPGSARRLPAGLVLQAGRRPRGSGSSESFWATRASVAAAGRGGSARAACTARALRQTRACGGTHAAELSCTGPAHTLLQRLQHPGLWPSTSLRLRRKPPQEPCQQRPRQPWSC